jgi:hypothetical protein
VIWLDAKESRPGVTPKPALSDYNSYKLETNLSETSNFVAVKKKVDEFVTLSDRYITAGLKIHEGLEKSLSHGAYYTRVRKHAICGQQELECFGFGTRGFQSRRLCSHGHGGSRHQRSCPRIDYLKYRELIGSFLDTGQEECIA